MSFQSSNTFEVTTTYTLIMCPYISGGRWLDQYVNHAPDEDDDRGISSNNEEEKMVSPKQGRFGYSA